MPHKYAVPDEAAGQRLDAWLALQLEGVSRARVQLLLSQGKVLVNGAAAKPSLKLRGGESVEVLGEPAPEPLRAVPESIPLDIVYEDEDISVINKPAGMMVHAGSGATGEARNRGTLVNALLSHYAELSHSADPVRPGIVHRLDKQTSGLIIVARNDAAHMRLSEMFSHRQIRKTYIALVHGAVKQEQGTINAPISRDMMRRTRMTTRREAGARSAVSHYAVLRRIESRFGKFTLVSVRIETGRTHQIRVHLNHIGHPLVGDPLYGGGLKLPKGATAELAATLRSFRRQALHAERLSFIHPATAEEMSFNAERPEDQRLLIEALRADLAQHGSEHY